VASLTNDSIGVIYDRNIFTIQANTGHRIEVNDLYSDDKFDFWLKIILPRILAGKCKNNNSLKICKNKLNFSISLPKLFDPLMNKLFTKLDLGFSYSH
jgi:hypothetical protein